MNSAAIAFPLTSNGFTLSTTPERLGRLEPIDPTRPISELRERYASQGYLWLKGILPRKEVLEFRARFFSAFREANLIAPDSDPVEGIYSGGPVNNDLARKILMEVVRWAEYEAFCLALPIRRFYEAFFDGAPYLHKRKLIRYSVPGDPRATGAHYDLVYLRGGTDNLCTSWIPIGDIPVEQGGLIYLEGSDAWARELEAEYNRQNQHLPREQRISAYNQHMTNGWLSKDLPSLADQLNTRWLIADYEAGDMVVHSPYMVHAATANVDPTGRMRLSTDIRYQRVRDEIDVRWQNHWSLDDML
ncbi:MAG: phytanoyl-CoA dioxygenase [Candidatus Roseilinea sp.]|nr:MAG: phytanoyl-CoA dioxygenase [Candidatus Roseilinea sp.]